MGLTPEYLAANRALIMKQAMDPMPFVEGRAIPSEVEELLDFDTLKYFVIDGLFGRPGGINSVIVELPGTPWIVLGTDSENPERAPWYVRFGKDSWMTADDELARALLVHLPREERWNPRSYGVDRLLETAINASRLRAEVSGIYERRSREIQADFEKLGKKFDVDEDRCHEHAADSSWPLKLTAITPALIDVAYVGYLKLGLTDWNSALDACTRAEAIVQKFQWLREWKQTENGSIALLLLKAGPPRLEADDPLARAWRESGLDGEPQFRLECSIHRQDADGQSSSSESESEDSEVPCARVICSESGAILYDCRAGSPLPEFRSKADVEATGQYVLARPGKACELRKLSASAEHR
jgi:hypothetical protein